MPYSVLRTGDETVDRNLDAIAKELNKPARRMVAGTVTSAAIVVAAATAVDSEFLSAGDSKALDDVVPAMAITATPPSTIPVGLYIVASWCKNKGIITVRTANPSSGSLTIPAGVWAFLAVSFA